LLHTPSDAVSAHDLQTPVQAVSQQTPCSQKLDRHSSFFVQSAPFGLRPQDPFWHTAGAWHWLSFVHDALHASMVGPHANGKHAVVGGVTHAPLPSQEDSGVNWLDAEGQVAGLQGVPDGHRWQAPASHLPLVPQVDAACIAHSPDGSFAPVATFEQTPSIPATHDLQAVLQAESQQTPCAQKPLWHSSGDEQVAPWPPLPHEFIRHWFVGGFRHWVSLVQALKQREPLQT